ncbi:right-handed parallel beta-helix repeat-containing protein [Sneathiella glossodoripedis]|uniref:right-handed parallel beta-helix repeat-containing protein n=1 Tax=Sneathiella glossodoripedis TaxID=418853 RepID=UPI0004722FB4|nr:right-handed parallel beta-helix repeat-containing protein [Sneathiella glossodoripedis]
MTDCDVLEKPPPTFAPAIIQSDDTNLRTLLVTPRGDARLYKGKVHLTLSFAEAASQAEAGDRIKLLPGKYYRAVEFVNKRGSADKPIVIEGSLGAEGEKLTHICGTNAAGSIYPQLPDWSDYAFIKLKNCAHICVSHVKVESCWPSFLYAENSSHVSMKEVSGQDGSYLMFIRGPDASDILVEGCHWVQDPTATLWSAIDWEESHHGRYAYYNGALVGGVDVRGNLLVHGNVIRNAYNGIRFSTSSKEKSKVYGRFNVNARIYNNQFENIRDNAVEPETTLLNWHIHDNVIKNAHAAFSIHDFYGGYLYIYGNRLWFDERGGADYQDNRGGKIYKLRRKGPMPDLPVHIFHNSIYSRTYLIKRARSKNLYHRGNAVQFCSPSDHERCTCRPGREFLRAFPVDADENPLPWDETVLFDGDASNKDFGEILSAAGQEQNGKVLGDLGFEKPVAGDLSLCNESKLRNQVPVFTLVKKTDLPPGQESWKSWQFEGAAHIGAYQEQGRAIALPFYQMTEEEVLEVVDVD